MKKSIISIGILFVGVGALLLSIAPDTLSMLIIGAMCLIIAMGFIMGMAPTVLFEGGFKQGMKSIERVQEVNASTTWIAVEQADYFFHQTVLDKLFHSYKSKIRAQKQNDMIVSDIEDIINEEALALRSWQSVMIQIPGTLTGLGILGTFLGLITGISGVGFSSVEAALSSINILLAGIQTAFYTSVVGVIFSIMFNIIYKFLWNSMVRSMGLFMEEFHMNIQPDVEEQMRIRQYQDMQKIVERLDRLPKDRGFSLATIASANVSNGANELQMMPEIRDGLKNGEFVFFVQPRYDLGDKKVIGGEALIRWNHSELGVMSPKMFLPVVEQNGFITKLDKYIWEEVVKTIRRWIDAGIRPIPISVNISKMDILAMDVAQFFTEMVHKYHLPPRYLELEIAQNAYIQSTSATLEAESSLRQSGFKVIVDGFNGDFATLTALGKSQADAMKLDLRFVDDRDISETIEDIFEQARKIRIPIVSVGIENTEQLNVLKHCGCTEGQGFYLDKPVSLEEFEALINE